MQTRIPFIHKPVSEVQEKGISEKNMLHSPTELKEVA